MKNHPKSQCELALAITLSTILLVACDRTLQRTWDAEVWFASAPAVPAGTPVMVGENTIGKTGRATVHDGSLLVPLVLSTADSVPDRTIFVLQVDTRGTRLSARPRGQPLRLSGDSFRFQGAAGEAEYWLILAKEKFQEWTK